MAHTGYVYWGRISRPHGFKGEVSLIIENDLEFKKKLPEAVFIEKGSQLLPYFLVQIKESNKGAILGMEECTSDAQAKTLYGLDVYIRESDTKKPKQEVGYGFVAGFEAVDENLGSLGKVVSIMEMPMQQLFVFEINGKEVLVPAVPNFVKKVDKEGQKLHLDLPEGLLDVYLSTGSDRPDDGGEEESDAE